jgi:hypothetical protein
MIHERYWSGAPDAVAHRKFAAEPQARSNQPSGGTSPVPVFWNIEKK